MVDVAGGGGGAMPNGFLSIGPSFLAEAPGSGVKNVFLASLMATDSFSKRVAMTTTLISSSICSSKEAPKIMFASGCAAS